METSIDAERHLVAPITVHPYDGPVVRSGGLPAETHADLSDRERLDLGGRWTFQFDFHDRGLRERWFLPNPRRVWQTIPVPGSWDTELLNGFNRQTIGWYTREFRVDPRPGRVFRLRFDGIFREAKIWLNGRFVGEQRLPYVPFAFDVTRLLDFTGPNTLVVRVDDRIRLTTLPCSNVFTKQKHGWFPYGGITRPVCLEAGLPLYPAQLRIDARPDGEVRARLLVEEGGRAAGVPPQGGSLRAWITAHGDERVLLEWPAERVPAGRTLCRFAGRVEEVRLWSPAAPENRYRLHLELQTDDGAAEHAAYDFAFRTFEARDGRFLLNGEDHFLRGINRHEDHPKRGPTFDEETMREEIALLKALHVDFVRPGHYPVDVRVLKALEDAGIMTVEEIPVYQLNTLQLAWPGLRRLAREILEVTIIRDYNRPGVVMWSISNEIHPWFPAASAFTRDLYRTARAQDPHRPVMMARVTLPAPLTLLDVFDRACGLVDVVGVNEYVGWYFGRTDQVKRVVDRARRRHPAQTWMISEYGADALADRHQAHPPGDEPTRDHSYSEEYQAYFHRQHLRQFAELPYLRGVMPWVLSDFRMEWEPNTGKPHPVPLTNLKGLTSADRRSRKAVFDVIAGFYEGIQGSTFKVDQDEP